METEWEAENFEFESDQEANTEMYGETDGEFEAYGEMYNEAYGETEGFFNEADEMELAAELLSVSSEEELDQFLGGLFKKVARGIGKVIKSPAFKPLGGILKGIAKQALPLAGGALGSLIPIPGVGTALGTAVGSAAGNMFGLELEGLSGEDQEFEVARRFVRLAGDAAQEVASAPANAAPPQVAQNAMVNAAEKHAPGLLTAPNAQARGRQGQAKHTGRWIRRGKTIILFGL
jgi:hypothetical protein